ncbi:MAG: SBBP repeat-containing protein [Phycisphaerae bacterium]
MSALFVAFGVGSGSAEGQYVITEIIDSTGDGAGNGLDVPEGIAVDGAGNVYVTGFGRHNAFKITPAGVITQIIDATGDGAGNGLDSPEGVAVDTAGNVYVLGAFSDNAFKIAPDCNDNAVPDAIDIGNGTSQDCNTNGFSDECETDSDGDGVCDTSDACPNTPAGLPVDCEGRPLRDCNGDCLFDRDDISCIVNELLNQ